MPRKTFIPELDNPEDNIGSRYGSDGAFAYSKLPTKDLDNMMADAMYERYKNPSWKELAKQFHQEVGLNDIGPYKLKVSEQSMNPWDMGSYNGEMIKLNKSQNDSGKLMSTIHEQAHAADDLVHNWNPPNSQAMGGPLHFKDFTDFDPEMAMSIKTQNAIEQGREVPKELLKRYPWLQDVNPNSSNQLANPWTSLRGRDGN